MKFPIGLALGGGAARGLAHLGVIKALHKAGIPINIVSGTSIGAIIGALYAVNANIDEALKSVGDYLDSPDFDKTRLEFIQESDKEVKSYFSQLVKYVKTGLFFAISIYRSSFISEENFQNNLEHILPKKNIEECALALGLSSMNLDTGEEKIFSSGNIIQRVMASCAIPGVFPPIVDGENTYVDGSWVNPVPVNIAHQLGAKFVIAVDVAPGMNSEVKELKGFDITLRAAEGSRIALKNLSIKDADVSLKIALKDVHWADFSQLDKCVEEGERITSLAIEEIKKKIFWKRLKSRVFL